MPNKQVPIITGHSGQYVLEGSVEQILGVLVSFVKASWKKYDAQGTVTTGECELPDYSSGRTKSYPIEAKNTERRATTRSTRPEPYQTRGKGKHSWNYGWSRGWDQCQGPWGW